MKNQVSKEIDKAVEFTKDKIQELRKSDNRRWILFIPLLIFLVPNGVWILFIIGLTIYLACSSEDK